MNNRLLEIIKYKTGGRQSEFAASLGWTPQYLAKLLKGENFGIRPVMTMLAAFPDINARWFMLGEGDMIEEPKYSDIRKTMLGNMTMLLDVEKFMPVMSPEELRRFERIVAGNEKADFSPELLEKWGGLLQEREEELNAKFTAAAAKSDRLCKQKRAKK
jgi:transcriptional regulator with XRE-family HTH domain